MIKEKLLKVINSLEYVHMMYSVLQLRIDHHSHPLLHPYPVNIKLSSKVLVKTKAFIDKHRGLRITYIV